MRYWLYILGETGILFMNKMFAVHVLTYFIITSESFSTGFNSGLKENQTSYKNMYMYKHNIQDV